MIITVFILAEGRAISMRQYCFKHYNIRNQFNIKIVKFQSMLLAYCCAVLSLIKIITRMYIPGLHLIVPESNLTSLPLPGPV